MKDGNTMDFSNIRYTHVSPIARKLFGIQGVSRVFLGKDFISITKEEQSDWALLKPDILGVITDNFVKGIPIVTEEEEPEDTKISAEDTEAVQMIKEIIETRVRPFV